MSDRSLKKRLKALLRPIYLHILSRLPLRARVIFGYVVTQRRFPNIDAPTTFNEKVLWRKIYDRDARLPNLVDKITAKAWIAERFSAERLIPTLAVYATPEELDFTKSPLNKPPYVLKTNHGSATNIYVKTAVDLQDTSAIRERLRENLKHDHGATRGEWAYTRVKRQIFVEPFIDTTEGYLTDYRFHVFHGSVELVETTVDSSNAPRMAFFDKHWQPVADLLTWGFPRFDGVLPPPTRLDEMVQMAETIGKEFTYLRVDLYEINGEIKFGELTFYPGAGHDRFDPPIWDERFGALWRLPIRQD